MKRIGPFLVLVLLLLPACGDLFDPAAAVVDGEKITLEEVEAGLEEFEDSERFAQLADESEADDVGLVRRQFEQGYLATLVRRAVLEPRARELGIEITEADVDTQIELIRADFPDEEAFEAALAEQALDLEQLRGLVRDRLLEQTIRAEVTQGVGPSQAEIEAYYEENVAASQEVRVQHILVEDGALAERLASELQEAPEDEVDQLFRALAREHSTDPGSAEQGGMLGFAPLDQYVPEFAEAARALDVGEISDPVQTDFGWHILRVLEERQRSLEDVRAEIVEQLSGPIEEEAWSEWLRQAYEDADVRINPRYGELDPTTGQIVDPDAASIPGGEAPVPGAEDVEHLEGDDHDDHDH